MALRPEHEIHTRRFGRNLGVGLALAAFIIVVFAMTVVKVSEGGGMTDSGTPATSATKEGTP